MNYHCSLPSFFYSPAHRGDFPSPSLSNSVCDTKTLSALPNTPVSDHDKTSLPGWLPYLALTSPLLFLLAHSAAPAPLPAVEYANSK